jgi:hypothetical protein
MTESEFVPSYNTMCRTSKSAVSCKYHLRKKKTERVRKGKRERETERTKRERD